MVSKTITSTSSVQMTDGSKKLATRNVAVGSRMNISRSKSVLKQIQEATALKLELITRVKKEIPKARRKKDKETDEWRLVRTIELSAESFDLKLESHPPGEIDRTTSMLSGPFFTSAKFPIPVGSESTMMIPVVQVDLREASSLIEEPLGDGLLQLWYDLLAFKGHIRVIPRSAVHVETATAFDLVLSNPFEGFPLPMGWEGFLTGGQVFQISRVVSRGLQSQGSRIDIDNEDMAERASAELFTLLEKYRKITKEKGAEYESRYAKLFGTFYPIQYSAADADKKCLLSIGDWGSSGGAQIFYEIEKKGSVSFTFWDCMR